MGTQGRYDLKKFLSINSKYKKTQDIVLRYSQKVYYIKTESLSSLRVPTFPFIPQNTFPGMI